MGFVRYYLKYRENFNERFDGNKFSKTNRITWFHKSHYLAINILNVYVFSFAYLHVESSFY